MTLATLAVIALAAAVLVLEAGVLHRTVVVRGPFAVAQGGDVPIVAIPVPSSGWLVARPDDEFSDASRLRLWIDGHEVATAHAADPAILAGDAFRHPGSQVFTTLPPAVANDAEAVARLRYPLQFGSRWIAVLALPALFGAWLLAMARRCAPPRLGRMLARPAESLRLALWIPLVATLSYGAFTAWAWATGWALPATAPIRLSGLFAAIAREQAWIPPILMGCATLGLLCRWTASILATDAAPLDLAERRLTRTLERLGAPILLGLVLMSLGSVWAGIRAPNEYSIFSLVGLVPFSDAGGYWADANRYMRDGFFGVEGARHPMAQMMRTALIALGGLDYVRTLLLQGVLLAGSLFVAARSVGRWLGPWASMIFLAQGLAFTTKFVPDMATESLGFVWALVAVSFVVTALRRASAAHAVVATFSMTVALVVRMGGLFTIPALLVWTMLFADGRRRAARIGAVALGGILAVLIVNSLVGRMLSREPVMAGSNFAYTLCGMTIGTDWSECPRRYRPELAPEDQQSESALVALILEKAKGHFLARPSTFFYSLFDSAAGFVLALPSTVVGGLYAGRLASPLLWLLLLVAAAGLAAQARSMPRREAWFWALFWLSTLASAALVFYGDGRRTMSASYPLVALFVARGFASRSPDPSASRALGRPRLAAVWAGPAVAMAAILVAPSVARARLPPYSDEPVDGSHEIVFGKPRMTGVLVEPDGAPLPKGTASIHLADFTRIVEATNLQDYQNLVSPPPPPPFGFVTAPSAARGGADEIWYIVPPEVLTRAEVPRWRFDLTQFGVKPGGVYWFMVSHAAPFER